MKIFGSWSVISFLRFVAQFIWAVFLLSVLVHLILLGMFIYSDGEIGALFFVYIDSSFINLHLKEVLAEEAAFLFSSGSLEVSFTPIRGEMILGSFLLIFQTGIFVMGLYGFSVLKRVLNAMHKTDTFTVQNGSDIRIVGILLIIAAPLIFLFEWGVKLYFESHVVTEEIIAKMPPFDFTLLFAGLICFVLAEILNQAAIMHEEHKLTV
jgi:hypothetical protein